MPFFGLSQNFCCHNFGNKNVKKNGTLENGKKNGIIENDKKNGTLQNGNKNGTLQRNMAPKKNAKFCNGVRVLYKALSVLLALLRELPFISYLRVLILSIFGQN